MGRSLIDSEPAWRWGADRLRVLLVTRSGSDAVFVEGLLRSRVSLATAFSCPEALSLVDKDDFDVCLFDLELGESSLLRFLRTLRAWGDEVPVVVLASPDDEQITVQALRQGARDYLLRGSLSPELMLRSFYYAGERRKSEAALRQSSRSYRNLFERSLAGSFRLSLQGELLDCNPSFLRILGYASKEQALSDAGLRLAARTEEQRNSDWLLDLCLSRNRQVCLRRKDGQPVEVLISAFTVEGESGEPQSIEGTLVPLGDEARLSAAAVSGGLQVVDTTAVAEPSEEEAARQRLAALGKMVGVVVHDLNNQLTAILGYANLLSAELAGGVAQTRAEEVRKAVQRARILTRQLLGVEAPPSGDVAGLELGPVLEGLRSSLEQRLGPSVELVLDLEEGTPPVCLDHWELERVVTNLVLNAKDAMPGGGGLVISSRGCLLEQSRVMVRGGLAPGRYMVLTVRDSGVGMDEKTRERIFEPFFTTKSAGSGTGLGLVSVADIVRRAHGAVSVSSTVGQGTRVEVWLPAATMVSAEAL